MTDYCGDDNLNKLINTLLEEKLNEKLKYLNILETIDLERFKKWVTNINDNNVVCDKLLVKNGALFDNEAVENDVEDGFKVNYPNNPFNVSTGEIVLKVGEESNINQNQNHNIKILNCAKGNIEITASDGNNILSSNVLNELKANSNILRANQVNNITSGGNNQITSDGDNEISSKGGDNTIISIRGDNTIQVGKPSKIFNNETGLLVDPLIQNINIVNYTSGRNTIVSGFSSTTESSSAQVLGGGNNIISNYGLNILGDYNGDGIIQNPSSNQLSLLSNKIIISSNNTVPHVVENGDIYINSVANNTITATGGSNTITATNGNIITATKGSNEIIATDGSNIITATSNTANPSF